VLVQYARRVYSKAVGRAALNSKVTAGFWAAAGRETFACYRHHGRGLRLVKLALLAGGR
jgi:hypothetical protein